MRIKLKHLSGLLAFGALLSVASAGNTANAADATDAWKPTRPIRYGVIANRRTSCKRRRRLLRVKLGGMGEKNSPKISPDHISFATPRRRINLALVHARTGCRRCFRGLIAIR